MTLQVCCGPGVVCHATVPARERLRALPRQLAWLLIGISGAELERRGECESRNWRTISRIYYIKVMPTKMHFVGQAPHACRFKAKRYSYSVIRSARELSGAAARLINAALSRRASRTPPSVDSRGLAGLQRSRRALRAAELTRLLESSPPCFVARAPPCATRWIGPPSSKSRRARPEVLQASGAAVRRPASALSSPEL